MDKVYSRINWQNEPSTATPINEVNLNRIDYATNEIDNRVISLDLTKASQNDLLASLKDVTYDTQTGIFQFSWNDGRTKQVDLNIEKIPVSFSMDAAGVITMITADGSRYTADIGSIIIAYDFIDSETIEWQVRTDENGDKHIKADILEGSIDGSKLEPNYLANVTIQAANASASAASAKESEDNAKHWAEEAEKRGDITWNNTTGKPFESIGENLSVDENGRLNATGGGGGASTWSEVAEKPFEAIGENLTVDENGYLNAEAGGIDVPAHPKAWYEEHWDEIPEGGHYIITDDYEDTDWRGHIEEEISDVKQDLTQLEEDTKILINEYTFNTSSNQWASPFSKAKELSTNIPKEKLIGAVYIGLEPNSITLNQDSNSNCTFLIYNNNSDARTIKVYYKQ